MPTPFCGQQFKVTCFERIVGHRGLCFQGVNLVELSQWNRMGCLAFFTKQVEQVRFCDPQALAVCPLTFLITWAHIEGCSKHIPGQAGDDRGRNGVFAAPPQRGFGRLGHP